MQVPELGETQPSGYQETGEAQREMQDRRDTWENVGEHGKAAKEHHELKSEMERMAEQRLTEKIADQISSQFAPGTQINVAVTFDDSGKVTSIQAWQEGAQVATPGNANTAASTAPGDVCPANPGSGPSTVSVDAQGQSFDVTVEKPDNGSKGSEETDKGNDVSGDNTEKPGPGELPDRDGNSTPSDNSTGEHSDTGKSGSDSAKDDDKGE
jgi:hypothetical protein